MDLTLSQLQHFTAGAVSVTQTNGAFCFSRFTDAQIEAFGTMHPDFYPRARATNGCRIDFHTDSPFLTLGIAAPGKYEVMINALPRLRFVAEDADTLTMDLEPGEKRVTIVLPSHSEGRITSVSVADGASLLPHTYSKKLLFLGDSITQGWDSQWDCLSFAWQVSSHYNADAMILGVGGSRFCSATLQNVGFDPDAIIIAYGTNDYFHFPSLTELRNACQEYLDTVQAQYPDRKIFCITPIWRADDVNSTIGSLDSVRSVISTEASSRGFTVINGNDMVPHLPEFFADKTLHPNDLGFSLYARNLIHALDRHL